MAIVGQEQSVEARGARSQRSLARYVELTVLGWAMSLLAFSLERVLVGRGEREPRGV